MPIDFDDWRCTMCGERVSGMPADSRPSTEIRGGSGRPTLCVVLIGEREVHTCELAAAAAPTRPIAAA